MIDDSVQVAGNKVAFVSTAGSGRPVVLVHGNSSSARAWQPLLSGPFGERFRCLALDLPGHGHSDRAAHSDSYSIPGYANMLTGFLAEVGAPDAVLVGWSLGGHIVLEAAPSLPDAAGFVIFGAPPVGDAAKMAEAFLPNPAMNVGFTADVTREDALAYAASSLAPGSPASPDQFVADILATDGAARAGLFASIGEGRFGDEVAILAGLTKPIAVLHGESEQLVSLDYLRGLDIPTAWRGGVQVLPGVGHSPHVEAPELLADILSRFIEDLD